MLILLLSIPLIAILVVYTKVYRDTPLPREDNNALDTNSTTNSSNSTNNIKVILLKQDEIALHKSITNPRSGINEDTLNTNYPNICHSGAGTNSTISTNSTTITNDSNTLLPDWGNKRAKSTVLITSVLTLLISLVIFAFYDLNSNQFQFVQEYHEISSFNLYLGIDGLSIYFVLLTTIIMPISLLSNWISISFNLKLFLIAILLLEALLLSVFLVLDILLYYIFFESILPPLFILIGSFGSSNRVRASFYLFLYTLLGSLFLLLSILSMSSITGTTDFDALYKMNFNYYTQIFLFCGIFIAFAVKTPIMFLNSWLLKAHVESPLSGSIILAAIVLKLSLYGILRLILPLLAKASLNYTFLVYVIGVITIIYASISTLRTIDVKELIAYSSVSHAAVYLMGVFSNIIQGIEGGIALGLAHGFVSSGLFICAGGILYDRSHTRLITYYRGIAQIMPLFSILFFVLCLGNCGAPLTLNFVGEFLSLYGAFERLPLLGVLASSSIVFSAAYTIYMYNRIAFSGSYSKFFNVNIPDLNKREFYILLTLVLFTLALGIYPAVVLDGLHYSVTTLLYSFFENNSTLTNVDNLLAFIPFFITKKIRNYTNNLSMLEFKFLAWGLNSLPKPHTFTSLHVQSGLSFTLGWPFTVYILFSIITDQLFKTNQLFITGQLVIIVLCISIISLLIYKCVTDQNIQGKVGGKEGMVPGIRIKDKPSQQPRNPTVVDLARQTIINSRNLPTDIIYDTLDRTGFHLKALYPGVSHVQTNIVVNGLPTVGIKFSQAVGDRNAGSINFRETGYTDHPLHYTGIWIPKPNSMVAAYRNSRITSAHLPIITNAEGRSVFVID